MNERMIRIDLVGCPFSVVPDLETSKILYQRRNRDAMNHRYTTANVVHNE